MRIFPVLVVTAFMVTGCTGAPPLPNSSPSGEAPPTVSAPDEPEAQETDPTSQLGSLGDISELPYEGVSAHLEALDSGYRLFYASMTAGGQVVSECDPSFACETRAVLDRMSDLTVIETGSGVRRGFWVEMNPDTAMKEIYSGQISDDGTTVLARDSLGYSGDISWGVPDAVTLPDGRVRIYWVVPGDGRASERIVSATFTDTNATIFEMDEGFRLEGGWVDFEVLAAEDGNWLAVMSSSPETLPESPQGVFLATSQDGIQWVVASASLTPSDMSYLDPTGVRNDDGTYTLVMSVAPNELGTRTYTLASATLSLR